MSRRALRRYLSIVAMLLSVVMLIFSSPLGALATGTDGSEINEKIDVNDTGLSDQQANTSAQAGDGAETVNSAAAITLQQGEKTLEELSAMTVDLATIPECIDPAAALEKGHINRLSLQEKSSNTVIYQNINGTKTTYIFSKPVKYIDTDGTVKDKSSAVTAVLDNTYSYAMQSNSVKVYFPKTSSAGTLLTYGEYSVSMSPKGDMTAQPSYDSESGKVIYPYVFGMNTLLVYDTQTDGLKEDIVVAKNIGVNEFDFEMTLSGLVPYKENGIWYLKNAQDETVGSLGQIIVNDSAGNRAIGEMTVTATDVSGKYDVTVIAPESFMNADSTVYPVYVDPSVTIYEDGYYTYLDEWGDPVYVDYDAIVDIGLYSEEYGATYHQEEYDHHTIGYAVGGEGRIVYRLYDFYGEYGQYKDIPYTQIGSVELHAEVYPPQTYEDESDALITVNPMNVLGVDDNSNAVYNEEMLNGYSTWNQSTSLINVYSTELVVDITDIALGWARYNAGESVKSYDNPANGFVVRCDTDASHTIYSLEASGSSNVYVVVDTSVFGGGHYIMANMEDVFLNLSGGTGINVSETTTPETVKWYIDYQGSDDYIIRSFTDPNICLRKNGYYPAAGDITTVDISQYIWNIEYSSYSGVIISSPDGYKLCYTPTDGIYLDNSSESPISTWGLITISDYHTIQSAGITTFPYLEEGSNTYLEIVCSPANSYWSWEECFNWSSSSTAVATVDSDGRVWAHSPGTTTITAVHKIWDISCEIDIKVCTVFKDDEGETIQSFTTLVINNKTRGFLSKEIIPRKPNPHLCKLSKVS